MFLWISSEHSTSCLLFALNCDMLALLQLRSIGIKPLQADVICLSLWFQRASHATYLVHCAPS